MRLELRQRTWMHGLVCAEMMQHQLNCAVVFIDIFLFFAAGQLPPVDLLPVPFVAHQFRATLLLIQERDRVSKFFLSSVVLLIAGTVLLVLHPLDLQHDVAVGFADVVVVQTSSLLVVLCCCCYCCCCCCCCCCCFCCGSGGGGSHPLNKTGWWTTFFCTQIQLFVQSLLYERKQPRLLRQFWLPQVHLPRIRAWHRLTPTMPTTRHQRILLKATIMSRWAVDVLRHFCLFVLCASLV